jgi:filamentous hemagglutinin family protein
MTVMATISITESYEAKGKENLTMSAIRQRPSWHLRIALAFGIVAAIVYTCDRSLAQITPDATLGAESSVVTPNANVRGFPAELIQGGSTRGANLFHSFSEFNVGNQQRVYFSNPAGIETILTRVTGNTLSNILGTLGVDGRADLFLLNPNGIIFGSNARLDVGGSFFATTANAVQFGDQGFWSATNPEAPGLLTIKPSAFFFNQLSAGTIINQSVSRNPIFPFLIDGLRVPIGENLVLLGGNVSIEGGRLNALGGRVEIGAVAETGTVGLNADGNLNFPTNVQRANVSFTNGARVDVALGEGGNIAVIGQNINVLGGSQIQAGVRARFASPQNQAGDIVLNALEEIRIDQSSFVRNVVLPNAIGNGGNVEITTGSLFLANRGALIASTAGQGNSGSVIITARDRISLDAGIVFSRVEQEAVGDGGNIEISTGSLFLTNGAQLSASTLGQGNARSVIITARDRIGLEGTNDDDWRVPSGIFNRVEQGAVGNGGSIEIATGSLSLTNGAQLSTSTYGQGNSGNVVINAYERISLEGTNAGGQLVSGIFSSVEEGAVGNGGNIDITTEFLTLAEGAQLVASTRGRGNAGNIAINADDYISLNGAQVFSRVDSEAVGDSGNIDITTGSLSIAGVGGFTASTAGQGNAGRVRINARASISIVGSSGPLVSGVFSRVEEGGVGDGRNIEITTGSLFLTNGGQLSVSTFGQGNSGSVQINARDRVIFSGNPDGEGLPSGAFTSVESGARGNGGNVEIAAESFSVTNGAQVSASAEGQGNAGSVIINARDHVLFSDGDAFSRVDAGGEGTGGDIQITTGSLTVTDDANLESATLGRGDAGSVRINARDRVLFERSGSAFSNVGIGGVGNGGNVEITAGSLSVSGGAQLIASTRGQGNAGSVMIDVRDRVTFDGTDRSGQLFSGAFSELESGAIGTGGNIHIRAESLFVANGGILTASTAGQGNAGSVIVSTSDRISLDAGAIFNGVEPGAVGNGSNIEITTGSLSLVNQSLLIANTFGQGNAGNITVRSSDSLSLSNSIIATAVDREATGQGGIIDIRTTNLTLTEQAAISAQSQGTGQAGEVGITADGAIRLTNSDITTSAFQASGGAIAITADSLSLNRGKITAATGTTGAQGAANITLQGLDLLLMGNESLISANALNQANGGNVTIDSTFIVATPPQGPEGSDITANAFEGNGGRVSITTQGLFGIEFRPKLTPDNDITVSSDFGLAGVFEQNTPGVDPSRGLAELPTDVVDASTQIDRRCTGVARNSSFTVTGRGGLPPSPNDPLQGEAVITNWVSLDSEVENNTPPVTTAPSSSSPRQLVEAQGWVFNDKGEVVLTASAPTVTPNESGFQELNCNAPLAEDAQEP